MPMPNEGFRWRPNDNGSITNHRYDLEAKKWLTAYKSADRNTKSSPSIGTVLGQIWPILALPLLLLVWLFVGVLLLFRCFGIILPILPGDISERDRRRQERERKAFLDRPRVQSTVEWPTEKELEKIKLAFAKIAERNKRQKELRLCYRKR